MNRNTANRTRYMAELALMAAIIFIMAFTPLGYFRTPGISITFLTVPVAVGAIILGRSSLRSGLWDHKFDSVLYGRFFRIHAA